MNIVVNKSTEVVLAITILNKFEKRNWFFSNQYFMVYSVQGIFTQYVNEISESDYLTKFFVNRTYNVVFVYNPKTKQYIPKQSFGIRQ